MGQRRPSSASVISEHCEIVLYVCLIVALNAV